MGKTGYAAANDSPGGGAAPFRSLDLGVTGAVIKNSPGRLYGWHIANTAAAVVFVKLYNKASAPTEVDVPVITLQLAATSVASFALPTGAGFSLGISARATTALADNSTAAPTTGNVVANFFYA